MIGCSVICGNVPYGWVEGHVYYKEPFCGELATWHTKFCSLADFKLCWKCWYVIIRPVATYSFFFGPWANASAVAGCQCKSSTLLFSLFTRSIFWSKSSCVLACKQQPRPAIRFYRSPFDSHCFLNCTSAVIPFSIFLRVFSMYYLLVLCCEKKKREPRS
jgi:hypothetical protein